MRFTDGKRRTVEPVAGFLLSKDERGPTVPIFDSEIAFTRKGVQAASEAAGVYSLVDDGATTYIGYADNIRERLSLHLDGSLGPCTQYATHFHEEVTGLPAKLCGDLIEEYRRQHGLLPVCNEPLY